MLPAGRAADCRRRVGGRRVRRHHRRRMAVADPRAADVRAYLYARTPSAVPTSRGQDGATAASTTRDRTRGTAAFTPADSTPPPIPAEHDKRGDAIDSNELATNARTACRARTPLPRSGMTQIAAARARRRTSASRGPGRPPLRPALQRACSSALCITIANARVRLRNRIRDSASRRWCKTAGVGGASRIGRPDLRPEDRTSYGPSGLAKNLLATSALESAAGSSRVPRIGRDRRAIGNPDEAISRDSGMPHAHSPQGWGRGCKCPSSCAKPCSTDRVRTRIVTYLPVGCPRWTCGSTWENADFRLGARWASDQFKSPSGHPSSTL